MPRSLIASDDFNRATLGSNWSNVMEFTAGFMTIESSTAVRGQYQAQGLHGHAVARWVGAGTFTANQYSSIKITQTASGLGTGQTQGATVRTGAGMDSTSSYVEIYYQHAGNIVMVKRVGGVYYQIATTAQFLVANDILSIECEGQVYRSYVNGVLLGGAFTYTDDGTTNGVAITDGLPGITGTSATLSDDWEGGAITSGAAPTVTGQPTSQTVTEPNTATFSATFSNSPTSFAWESSDNGGTSWGAVSGGSGATTASYTTPATSTSITGRRFRCTGTNASGSATTDGTATLTVNSAADTTPPVLTGSIGVADLTSTSYTIDWPTATDNIAVTGYEYSLDGGTSYINAGLSTSANITGRTPSTTDQVRVRAYDAANNKSTPVLSTSVNLPATTDTTPPILTGSITVTELSTVGYRLTWSAGSDNIAVTGYEYSLNGGTSYTGIGNVLTILITGRTPGTTDQVRVRAYDAAGNRSTPALSTTVNLANSTVTTSIISNGAGMPLVNTAVYYSFFPGGRIGALNGITSYEGTALTNSSGRLVVTGLPPVLGVLLIAKWELGVATDKIYYEAVTPV